MFWLDVHPNIHVVRKSHPLSPAEQFPHWILPANVRQPTISAMSTPSSVCPAALEVSGLLSVACFRAILIFFGGEASPQDVLVDFGKHATSLALEPRECVRRGDGGGTALRWTGFV